MALLSSRFTVCTCAACGCRLSRRTALAVTVLYMAATAALFGAVWLALTLSAYWPLVAFLIALALVEGAITLFAPLELKAARL
jgi:hypothetical protein